jgi:hypothetical protein
LEVVFPPVNRFKTDAANPGGRRDAILPDSNRFSHILIPLGLDGDPIQLWPQRFILRRTQVMEKQLICHGQRKTQNIGGSHGVLSPWVILEAGWAISSGHFVHDVGLDPMEKSLFIA